MPATVAEPPLPAADRNTASNRPATAPRMPSPRPAARRCRRAAGAARGSPTHGGPQPDSPIAHTRRRQHETEPDEDQEAAEDAARPAEPRRESRARMGPDRRACAGWHRSPARAAWRSQRGWRRARQARCSRGSSADPPVERCDAAQRLGDARRGAASARRRRGCPVDSTTPAMPPPSSPSHELPARSEAGRRVRAAASA